jgi:hypothetical protein
MSHTKVAVYRRDSTGYHKCVPQGIYPTNTTHFHLRYEVQKGKRTYERLPDGTDYKSAVRAALRSRSRMVSSVPAADSTLKAAKISLEPILKTVNLTTEQHAPPQFIVTFMEEKSDFHIEADYGKFALNV